MANYTIFYSGPFSNWHRSPFMWKGQEFNTSEQAMMWAKAKQFNDDATAQKIMETLNPAEQKALGRQVKNYDDTVWASVRYDLAVDFLLAKFTSTQGLKDKLLETKDTILVEASPTDVIWGIGMAGNNPDVFDESKWRGQNLLGKALTEVRKRIKEQQDR